MGTGNYNTQGDREAMARGELMRQVGRRPQMKALVVQATARCGS